MATEIAELALVIDSSEASRGIKRVEERLKKMADKADVETKKAQGAFQRLKKTIFSLRGALLSIGALAFLKNAVKQATDFEKKMAEVNTLVSDTFAFDKLTKSVEDLSVAFGTNAVEQAGAAYSVISAGATSAAEATATLAAANELALGGVTNIETAVDGLTSTMNAYGPSVGTATSVSDRFFVAVKAGKTTVAELSRTIGLVAPVAANLGISLDEVLAATAALTKGGIKTSIAMAGLRQVMASVLKPTSEAAEASARLGIDFNAAALKGKGLQGFLSDVVTKTKGSTTELGLLFGSVEALVPVLALAGQAGKDFEQILEDMSKSGGASAEAANKIRESFDFKFAVFREGVNKVIRDLGKGLLPLLSELITQITSAAKFVKENAEAFKILGQVLLALAAAKFVGPLINSIAVSMGRGAISAIAFTKGLTGVGAASRIAAVGVKGLRTAMALLGGPAGLVILAVSALVAYAGASDTATKQSKELRKSIRGVTQSLQEQNLELLDSQLASTNDLLRKAKGAYETMIKFTGDSSKGAKILAAEIKELNEDIRIGTERRGGLVIALEKQIEKEKELIRIKALEKDSPKDKVVVDENSINQLQKEDEINKLLLESQRSLATEKEKILIEFQQRKDALELASVEGNMNQQLAADELIIALEAQKKQRLEDLEAKHQKNIIKTKNRAFIFAEQLRDRDFTGALQSAQALTQGLAATSKKAFEINKTAGIASAIINTYQGVTQALANLPPPYSYVAAGVTLAAGLAKVNAIRSTSFQGGGGGGGSAPSAPSFSGSGGGLPSGTGDGTTSSFGGGEISSGSITNNSEGTTQSDGRGNIKIVNAFDFDSVGDYLNTDKGEKIVMNVIKKNAKALRQV